jgi:hypothetical protein
MNPEKVFNGAGFNFAILHFWQSRADSQVRPYNTTGHR